MTFNAILLVFFKPSFPEYALLSSTLNRAEGNKPVFQCFVHEMKVEIFIAVSLIGETETMMEVEIKWLWQRKTIYEGVSVHLKKMDQSSFSNK